MRKIISFLLLAVATAPAFADPIFNAPEPEVLSLLGIGALAFLISRRKKK